MTAMRKDIRPPHLGVAHFSAIAIPPAEFVTLAAGAGFSAVGFRLFPAFAGAPFYSLPSGGADAREVKARLAGEGIALHDIEFVVIDAAFDPASVRAVLHDAADLGARRLSVCGEDADQGRLTANFAALCGVAAEVGMGVDLENMGWRPVRTFADSLAIVEAAGAANGGVLVDALHFFRNGGTVAELTVAPAARIRGLQLCDVAGPAPATDVDRIAEARGGRLAPGAGELPLEALLRAAPPDATVSVEVPLCSGLASSRHLAQLFLSACGVIADAAGQPAD
jgi:sugar phosphate isomerase/epimerase